MPRKPKQPAKPKLPPYAMIQNGKWFVRRSFPTSRFDAKGNRVYDQYKQRCEPETAERAKEISDGMEAQFRQAVLNREKTPTLGEYLESYNAAKKGSISRRYHEILEDTYERYIKNDVVSVVEMPELKALAIQDFYTRLNSFGTSATMIKKTHD